MVLFLFLLFFIPFNAYAYLDLGSAGYLVQMALALLAGALFSTKVFWFKIRSFLGQVFNRRGNENKDKSNSSEENKDDHYFRTGDK